MFERPGDLYLFLLESIVVVVRDPLVTIPRDPLHSGRLIVYRLEAVFGDDVLNLLVVENSRGR